VGRAEEVRRVGKLLGEARLVTLTGPGGAGKTRLAVEAAGREPGDVCFVERAPVADGSDLPQALLGALGLRDAGLLSPPGPQRRGPPDSTARLVAALSDRRMLLVLDNCEHLVEAAARLSQRLLSACPMLRILATSREALGITGETLWPVPPLALPPPGTPPAEAIGYPAVRLFADRAARSGRTSPSTPPTPPPRCGCCRPSPRTGGCGAVAAKAPPWPATCSTPSARPRRTGWRRSTRCACCTPRSAGPPARSCEPTRTRRSRSSTP
jgi:hypothetical protein